MLERFHRTLNQMIGKVVSEGQRDWDQYVQPMMAAYRAWEHVVTEFSPNFLMLGREFRAPIDLVFGRPVEEADHWESTNEFVAVVQERYRRAYEIARKSLQVEATRRKDLYDRRVLQRSFPVGTWVWYYYPRRYVGCTPKWYKTYIGPMLVVEVVSVTNVRIQWNRRSKSMLVHADKLKLCKGDTPKAWLSGVERDATELEDAEEEFEMRRAPKEDGDEHQRMEGVGHATMDEAPSGEGWEKKPAGQKVATNSATGEHLPGPRNDPGRPTRSRQAPRRLLDYVRALHAATIDQSPIVPRTWNGIAN